MSRATILLTAVIIVASLVAGLTSTAQADGARRLALQVTATIPADASRHAYAGTRSCKKCHTQHHREWKKHPHSEAFSLLQAGARTEAKTKAGLDPQKDYTQDVTCLPCHTTGYGKPGGYAIPDPNDKKAVRKAKKLEGVGCEMCHGPGKDYIKVFKEILKAKRGYKVGEVHAVGLFRIEETICTGCHNDSGPTFKPFDFKERLEHAAHEHHSLKQRIE